MSNAGSSTKSWWSKVAGNKELRQNYIDQRSDRRTSSGLKSIAVAIGLKSRKPSREPLSPAVGSQASDATIDSAPKSPVDSLRPRQSLLTLADDPFAHPPIVFVRQSPVPSHLSVYSSPSVTDLVSSKTSSPIYRSSYASSSTNSNSLGPEVNSVTNSHHALPESKKLRLKRSIGSMQVKLPNDLSQQSSYLLSTTRSNPSSEGRRPLSDESPGRPRMRSRGMTVGGLPQKSGFFVKEQKAEQKLSHALTTSNVIPTSVKPPERPAKQPFILRQIPSSSRPVAPPTAPPTVGLPAPPSAPEQPEFPLRKGLDSLSPFTSSTSSLSFVNDHMGPLSPVVDDTRTSQQALPVEDSFNESFEPSSKSGPRTLKRPPSQRSLRRAASASSSMSSKTTTSPDTSENRKQRNSQQSRLPMPTLSLSIRTSFTSTSSHPRNGDPISPSSIIEQRKSRKRLFSNSQRPSTATCVSREDDSSSMLSLRSDHDTMRTSYKPWTVTRNYSKPSPSFWDEGIDTTSSNLVDYQPQAIMSRDELAKLDAIVSNREAESGSPMDSALPFPSLNSPEPVHPEPSRVALSPPPSTKPGRRLARSSDITLASSTSRSSSRRRPCTADPLVRDGSKETEIWATENRRVAIALATQLDIPDATGLPPPPRPRIISGSSVWSTSTTSTLIQSPVERPGSSKGKTLEPSKAVTISSSLQLDALANGGPLITTRPVPRSHTTSRGKTRISGLEMAIHRRSIMRKPSFLEIDGESDQESGPEMVEKRDSLLLNMKPPSIDGSSKTGESFLDFARESFHAARS